MDYELERTSDYIVTKGFDGEFEVMGNNNNIVFSLTSKKFMGCVVKDDTLFYYMERNNEFYEEYKIEDGKSIFCKLLKF